MPTMKKTSKLLQTQGGAETGRQVQIGALIAILDRDPKVFQLKMVDGVGSGYTEEQLKDPDKNIDAFLRMAGSGPAARSRLRALWDETEDALTDALVIPRDGARELAARRLTAAQIMVLVRTVTSAEVGDLIAKAADTEQARKEALKDWIRDAAGHLARGLQAAAR